PLRAAHPGLPRRGAVFRAAAAARGGQLAVVGPLRAGHPPAHGLDLAGPGEGAALSAAAIDARGPHALHARADQPGAGALRVLARRAAVLGRLAPAQWSARRPAAAGGDRVRRRRRRLRRGHPRLARPRAGPWLPADDLRGAGLSAAPGPRLAAGED